MFDHNQDIDAAAEVLQDGVEVHLNEVEVRQDEVDLVGEVGMIRNLADPFEGVEVHIVHVADILDNAAGVGDSFHWVDNFDYNHPEVDILEETAVDHQVLASRAGSCRVGGHNYCAVLRVQLEVHWEVQRVDR